MTRGDDTRGSAGTSRPVVVRAFAFLARLVLPAAFARAYGRAVVDAFQDLHGDRSIATSRRWWRICREIALVFSAAISARLDARRDVRSANGFRTVTGSRLRSVARNGHLALRGLYRQPAFTLFATVTLALGIGANTAIFSVVNAVLLRPLPFPEPERLVGIFATARSFRYGVATPASFRDWAQRDDVFEDVAAISTEYLHLTGEGGPERLLARPVSPSFFRILGVAPLLGRALAEGDDLTGASPVAVLGAGLWQRQFGEDSTIVGRSVVLNGAPVTVVGVMPARFDFPNGAELWTPLHLDPEMWQRRDWYFLGTVARLRTDVSIEEAQTRLDALALQLAAAYPRSNADRGIHIEDLHSVEVVRVRRHLWMLFAAVGLVLLTACTNVANLLLSRGIVRNREISIRAAVGAGRGQLVEQLLVESVVLAVIGGAVGIALAAVGIRFFVALSPTWFPRMDEVRLDLPVLGYTLCIAMLTGVAFGMIPALRVSRVNLADALKTSGGFDRRRGHRLGHALVVGETALALVLLVGAGLLLRSFHRLTTEPVGFVPANVLAVEIPLPLHDYPDDERRLEFFAALLERTRALPGVASAAATNNLPFSLMLYSSSFTVETGDEKGTEVDGSARTQRVSDGYFRTLGVPLKLGRAFSPADSHGGPPVAVVNEAFLAEFAIHGDPLQAGFRESRDDKRFEIVGVVGNSKHVSLDDEITPMVYFPMAQQPAGTMIVFLRTFIDPLSLTTAMRQAVRDLDATLPISRMSTMEQFMSDSVGQPRFYAVLLTIFAATAVGLACIGVYGLLSYQVAQRTREIGIRMTLGARRRAVVGLVVGQGLGMAIPGVIIGLGAAYLLTRLLEGLLFEITPTDPVTFAGVTAGFIVIAVAASIIPARKSTRINPIEALRSE